MLTQLRISCLMLLIMSLLTGGVYPLLVTAFAWVVFPNQAGGSLITRDDRAAGSSLIGQSFSRPEYFWGRLSATSPFPYNAASSSGSNFGPLHPGLKEAAQARIEALRATNASAKKVPIDLVTASASGLDPHISLAAAEFQVQRIATARKMPEDAVRELVRKATEGRQFGFLGEPRVNVLRLNLALDATK